MRYLLVITLLFLAACGVSQEEYDQLLREKQALEYELDKLKNAQPPTPPQPQIMKEYPKLLGKWCNNHGTDTITDDYAIELHQLGSNDYEMRAPATGFKDTLKKVGEKYIDTQNRFGEYYQPWGDAGYMGSYDEDGFIRALPPLPSDHPLKTCSRP